MVNYSKRPNGRSHNSMHIYPSNASATIMATTCIRNSRNCEEPDTEHHAPFNQIRNSSSRASPSIERCVYSTPSPTLSGAFLLQNTSTFNITSVMPLDGYLVIHQLSDGFDFIPQGILSYFSHIPQPVHHRGNTIPPILTWSANITL